MKRAMLKLLGLFLISLALVSCNVDKEARKETITGKSNEVVIVIGKESWKGEVGSLMRRVLAQPQAALPQNEPVFSLVDVPPEAFINLFKSHRNIITVKISSTFTEPKIEFAQDTWAIPQAVINIQASSAENFKELFTANGERIMGYFLNAEKDRLKKIYLDSHEKSVYNTLNNEFAIRLYVPVGFKVEKKSSSFAWVRYDTALVTQNIFIYTFPYESDSTFTLTYLLAKRVELIKKNIPGFTRRSYMSTDIYPPRDFNLLTHNGNAACEMRGVWKVKHNCMGGPFVSLSVLDTRKKRVVTVEGNVYAPKDNKGHCIRQLEAMIYSLEFSSQTEPDATGRK